MSRIAPLSTARTTSHFAVQVLGPFTLDRDGTPIDTAHWQRRVGTLFKLLVTSPERRRLREELAELLWPDSLPQAGAANLRLVLHLLRRELGGGEPSPVLLDRNWIGLNPAYSWEVDLDRFEQLTRTMPGDEESLLAAVRLYRGVPLLEHRYEDWAMPVREQLQLRWRQACLRLASLHRARGRQEEAVGWLEQVLEVDPLDEEATQELLAALRQQGRRTEALRRYRDFRQRLQEELQVAPMADTLAAAQGLSPPVQTPMIAITPRYGLSTRVPLVGRASELEQIECSLAACRGGRSGLLLLAGEAGMGKTRLLAEVARRGREAGMLVLAGGCYEHEGRLPFGPLHDALLDYLEAQPQELLQRHLEAELGALVQIVPELARRLEIRPVVRVGETGSQRLRLFLAVAHTLERISQERPLVLLLDDMQWADESSLQLLHFLLRQPDPGRVLVVCAFRQEEMPKSALQTQFSSGMEARTLLDLPPLSEQELSALLEERLGDRCSPTLLRALYERRGSNPLFALQMVRLLQQEKQLEQTADGWQLSKGRNIELPQAVRETVVRRLELLEAEEQEVLKLGAVLGREFPFAALEMMWQGEEHALFAALDGATAAYLLSEIDGRYSFRHPLLHEVIYEQVPRLRRLRLHERAGLTLETLYGELTCDHAAQLAYHFVQGGQPERSLPYAMQAGDQAESAFAHTEAERHYRMALELSQKTGSQGQEAETREKLGRLLQMTARFKDALRLLEQAATLYRAMGNREGEVRCAVEVGWLHAESGTWDEGQARIQILLKELAGDGPPRALAALHAVLSNLFLLQDQYDEALRASERASQIAQSLDDDRLRADVEGQRGCALMTLGLYDEALLVLESVIPLAEGTGDPGALIRALWHMVLLSERREEFGKAIDYLRRALDLADHVNDPAWIATLAARIFWLGDPQSARTHLEGALNVARQVDMPAASLYPLLVYLGDLAQLAGEWETGRTYLEEAITLAEGSGGVGFLCHAQSLLAWQELWEGRPEAALARLEPYRAAAEAGGLFLTSILAEAHVQIGNLSQAEEILTAGIERHSSHTRLPFGMTLALRAQGMALARQHRWEDAENVFAEAVSLGRQMHFPEGEAEALYAYGLMYLQKGQPAMARKRLEEALAIFRRLGARAYIERTEQALHAS